MYELAYHLNPNLEESEVAAQMQQIESLVTQSGGTVSLSKEPKKVHLSYPIDHQNSAFFGTVDFTGPADMIDGMQKQLKLHESVLRFLVVRKPEGKELRTFGEQRMRKVRTHTAPEQKPAPVATPEEQKQMEEKLEEALEKIS